MSFDNLENAIIERINENDINFSIELYKLSMSKACVNDKLEAKKWGRIYVKNEYDLEIVKKTMKEMISYDHITDEIDSCEYDYMSSDEMNRYDYTTDEMECKFKDKESLNNTGKFGDLYLKKLMKVLWNKGIEVYYVLNNEYDE